MRTVLYDSKYLSDPPSVGMVQCSELVAMKSCAMDVMLDLSGKHMDRSLTMLLLHSSSP